MSESHHYYETRAIRIFGPPTPVASDIARHLQSRQFLGMTVVVCRNPHSMLSSMRKQWLHLARNLQKQRASTLNAEEILRFTHTIMHMQHLQFVAQPPAAQAEAHIFFVTPEELLHMPPGCLSLYITTTPKATQLRQWVEALATDALVIDYEGDLGLNQLGLQPKANMEARMYENWRELQDFMQRSGVNLPEVTATHFAQSQAMDAALDALLNVSNDFLRRTAEFQHVISLSQPLKHASADQLRQFELVMRLAHRVQSLTPGSFSSYLVKNFGDHHADSFFLRDAAPEDDELLAEPTPEVVTWYSMRGVALTTEFI